MALDGSGWTFFKFGLIVTGKGEEGFLPSFLRSLTHDGNCTFQVVRRVDQRSPHTSGKKKLKMVGSGMAIPSRDVEQIGLPARNFLVRNPNSFVVLVDDLEHDRRDIHQEVFGRYRAVLDEVLKGGLKNRASVHFLVNMLEAYYFADIDAVNRALRVAFEPVDGDVEEIRHPKARLKEMMPGFDEVVDGAQIVSSLDMDRVLANPGTCASLRTLVKWCVVARSGELTDRFRLRDGKCCPVTGSQLDMVAEWSGTEPTRG